MEKKLKENNNNIIVFIRNVDNNRAENSSTIEIYVKNKTYLN